MLVKSLIKSDLLMFHLIQWKLIDNHILSKIGSSSILFLFEDREADASVYSAPDKQMLKPYVMFRHNLGGPWSSSISGSSVAFLPSRSCPVSPPSSHFNLSQMLSDVEGKHVQCEEQGSFQAHSPGRTETTHARELNPVHFWLLSNTWGFALILLFQHKWKCVYPLTFFMQITDSCVLMPLPFWHM